MRTLLSPALDQEIETEARRLLSRTAAGTAYHFFPARQRILDPIRGTYLRDQPCLEALVLERLLDILSENGRSTGLPIETAPQGEFLVWDPLMEVFARAWRDNNDFASDGHLFGREKAAHRPTLWYPMPHRPLPVSQELYSDIP